MKTNKINHKPSSNLSSLVRYSKLSKLLAKSKRRYRIFGDRELICTTFPRHRWLTFKKTISCSFQSSGLHHARMSVFRQYPVANAQSQNPAVVLLKLDIVVVQKDIVRTIVGHLDIVVMEGVVLADIAGSILDHLDIVVVVVVLVDIVGSILGHFGSMELVGVVEPESCFVPGTWQIYFYCECQHPIRA
jgi:hypothetical protein